MEETKIVCLVAAAGRGLRFGRELPKSFFQVEGRALLSRSLDCLRAWGGISRFVVMVPAGWEEKAAEILSVEIADPSIRVVTGGETRQESVRRGLAEAEGAGIVLIHDACRPFVSTRLIERVVAGAREYGAAVPALQATDTLARLRGEELESIVPRGGVVGIQTPQAFRIDILKKAYDTSEDVIATSTDESSLVLAAGMTVKVVEGERWNIKVTVKEDLEIMASFLAGKKLAMSDGEMVD